jgi:hypothetical protein
MHHRYPCFPILELQLLLFFTLAICDYLLEPIKSFSKVLNVGDTETFLVDESIGKRIKDMAYLLRDHNSRCGCCDTFVVTEIVVELCRE